MSLEDYRPLKILSLTAVEETIYLTIYAAIVERRLPPGTKLTEEKLATIFDVSRRRVKTVLQELARAKCVNLIPNRGAFVAQPSPDEAHDIFEARLVLERHTVQTLPALSKEQLQRLKQNIDKEQLAHKNGQWRDAIRLSGEFHAILADLANNQVIASVLHELIARTSLIIAMYGGADSPDTLCSCDEHHQILESLATQDVEQSIELMQKHLENIRNTLHIEVKPIIPVDLEDVLEAVVDSV